MKNNTKDVHEAVHKLNNLLTKISLEAELLGGELTAAARKQYAKAIVATVQDVEKLVRKIEAMKMV